MHFTESPMSDDKRTTYTRRYPQFPRMPIIIAYKPMGFFKILVFKTYNIACHCKMVFSNFTVMVKRMQFINTASRSKVLS